MIKYYDPFDNEIISVPKNSATFSFCPYAKYLKVNGGEAIENPDFSIDKFNNNQILKREIEYKNITDNLAFAYMADEITKETWLNARQEIKNKYPKMNGGE